MTREERIKKIESKYEDLKFLINRIKVLEKKQKICIEVIEKIDKFYTGLMNPHEEMLKFALYFCNTDNRE